MDKAVIRTFLKLFEGYFFFSTRREKITIEAVDHLKNDYRAGCYSNYGYNSESENWNPDEPQIHLRNECITRIRKSPTRNYRKERLISYLNLLLHKLHHAFLESTDVEREDAI